MANSINFGAGMRFYPSDQEILLSYLLNKHEGKPLPHKDIILERDIYAAEPWEIFRQCSAAKNTSLNNDDDDRVKYFFTTLKRKGKKRHSKRFERRVGNNGGTWHGSGKPKPIVINKEVKGYVTTFSYKNKNVKGKGSWIMKEYTFDEKFLRTIRRDNSVSMDCVVCRIKRKKDKDEYNVVHASTSRQISAQDEEEEACNLVIKLLNGINAGEDKPSQQDDDRDGDANFEEYYFQDPELKRVQDELFSITELARHDKFDEIQLPDSPYAYNLDDDYLVQNRLTFEGEGNSTIIDECYDGAEASFPGSSGCDRSSEVADVASCKLSPTSQQQKPLGECSCSCLANVGSTEDEDEEDVCSDEWWRKFQEMGDQLPDPPDDDYIYY